MHWFSHVEEFFLSNPAQAVVLMRLTDYCSGRVNMYQKIKLEPVCIPFVYYPKDISPAYCLKGNWLGTVLFFEFTPHGIKHFFPKFDPAAAKIQRLCSSRAPFDLQ